MVFAVVAIFCGFYLNITRMEWLVLVLTISLVIAAEMLNTAIEKTLDLLHPQQSPKVKFIKDVAAGAVLILALASVVVGILIFWGYI